MLLPEHSFAWQVAAFSRVDFQSLYSIAFQVLHRQFGEQPWKRDLNKAVQTHLWQHPTSELPPALSPCIPGPAGRGVLSWGISAWVAACTPPVLAYPLGNVASSVLPPLPGGVSCFSRWCRNTKQSLGVDCWYPSFSLFRIRVKKSTFVLGVSKHTLEDLAGMVWKTGWLPKLSCCRYSCLSFRLFCFHSWSERESQ